MNPRLLAITGSSKGTIFDLYEANVTLGREPANQICLNDLSVSRRHCRIQSNEDQFQLFDLGSRNSTFVNGVLVKEKTLAHGDLLKIGDYLFLFLLDDEGALSASCPVRLDQGQLVTQTTTIPRQDDAQFNQPKKAPPEAPAEAGIARDFNVLLKIGKAISSSGSIEALQRQLLDFILEVVPAERGAILLAGNSREKIASNFGWSRRSLKQPIEVSRNIVYRVLEEGSALLGKDVSEGSTFGATQNEAASQVHSLLAVPLVVFEKVIGAIYLDTTDRLVHFDDDHLQLMTAIAGIAAVALENARRVEWLEDETRRLQEEIHLDHDMIGESPRMRVIMQTIAKVAPTDSTVLIRGESGTGKELVARAVHRNSPRASKPFVAINCAALTETLLESELFGYEKGAFTGATTQKKGKLEVADGGTVFLDEVGELPPQLQAKLLRALQEQEFERVGGTRPIRVNIRFIAATNRDLEAAIKNNHFRADLYFRLNVVSLTVPPLRERREDIPLLANFFTSNYSQKLKREVKGISSEAQSRLANYDWPGNVRELENAIERAIVLGADDFIQPEDLPESLLEPEPTSGISTTKYEETLRESKIQMVLQALDQADGNQSEAAKLLGVKPSNLSRMIKNLNLKDRLGSIRR